MSKSSNSKNLLYNNIKLKEKKLYYIKKSNRGYCCYK